MQRRNFILSGIGAAGFAQRARARPRAQAAQPGALMLIGGAEDRQGDMAVLRRFVQLSRGSAPRIVVLPAASAFAEFVWQRYDATLAGLGVQQRVLAAIDSRDMADDAATAAEIRAADGVLITGGDQRRLAERLGGSAAEQALHQAFAAGACIAGTSAGAAVMSSLMLAGRSLSDGVGLLPGAIVDQHFSQRRRMRRLLRAVASRPELLGLGIDEDTALVIHARRGYEVVGAGAVTVVDATRLAGPIEDADPDELLLDARIQVQRIEPGTSYDVRSTQPADAPTLPAALWQDLPQA
jgi:cyanophycinase